MPFRQLTPPPDHEAAAAPSGRGARPRRSWNRTVHLLLGGFVVAGALACLPLPGERKAEEAPEEAVFGPYLLPTEVEAIRPPVPARMDFAELVTFPDDTNVLGVTAEGESRAYVVKTLEHIQQHVLNDRIGELPVSVTYCSLRECSKVFVGETGRDRLTLRTGGYHDEGGMLLHTDGELYYQETEERYAPGTGGAFPYTRLSHERTTWKQWKEGHPETGIVYFPTLTFGAWSGSYPGRRVAVPEEARVVGVLVGGQPRAYLLAAFEDLSNFVVYDYVGDGSVTVAYCPRSQQARAFTGPDAEHPWGLSFAGWDARSPDGEMLLEIGGELYGQQTGKPLYAGTAELPCGVVPSEQTTWGQWKKAHPGTSLYIGEHREYLRLPVLERGLLPWLTVLRYGGPFLPALLLVAVLLLARLPWGLKVHEKG